MENCEIYTFPWGSDASRPTAQKQKQLKDYNKSYWEIKQNKPCYSQRINLSAHYK